MSDQLSLLEGAAPAPEPPAGLTYIDGFVEADEEERLLERIDVEHDADWLPDLSRRVQHYGYKYDYQKRRVDRSMLLGALPPWLQELADRVAETAGIDGSFDQAIVNEYLPGQGIAEHIDCEPCFGDVVATLSLGSDIEMQFKHTGTGAPYLQRLRSRSLAILSGPVRYEWTHAIAKRRTDKWDGWRVQRQRRVSITFRTVILDD